MRENSVNELDPDLDLGAPRTSVAAKRPAEDFSAFCNRAVNNSWGYVWGGRGKVYDEAERDYLYSTYHNAKYDRNYYYNTQWARWQDASVCDCSGLIEAYSGLNRTAQSFYVNCQQKGRLGSFPKIQGYLVFRYSNSSGKMVHVGEYDGDESVIESKDSNEGVVKTTFGKGGWTHWGRPEFIVFAPPTFTLSRALTIETPLLRGSDVMGVQSALIYRGYNVGSNGADGIYGNDTAAAVKVFQRANQLAETGVGAQTARALGGTWAA